MKVRVIDRGTANLDPTILNKTAVTLGSKLHSLECFMEEQTPNNAVAVTKAQRMVEAARPIAHLIFDQAIPGHTIMAAIERAAQERQARFGDTARLVQLGQPALAVVKADSEFDRRQDVMIAGLTDTDEPPAEAKTQLIGTEAYLWGLAVLSCNWGNYGQTKHQLTPASDQYAAKFVYTLAGQLEHPLVIGNGAPRSGLSFGRGGSAL